MELTEKEKNDFKRFKAYYPYRKCYLVDDINNNFREIICPKTKHYINQVIKNGCKVYEIT